MIESISPPLPLELAQEVIKSGRSGLCQTVEDHALKQFHQAPVLTRVGSGYEGISTKEFDFRKVTI